MKLKKKADDTIVRQEKNGNWPFRRLQLVIIEPGI